MGYVFWEFRTHHLVLTSTLWEMLCLPRPGFPFLSGYSDLVGELEDIPAPTLGHLPQPYLQLVPVPRFYTVVSPGPFFS